MVQLLDSLTNFLQKTLIILIEFTDYRVSNVSLHILIHRELQKKIYIHYAQKKPRLFFCDDHCQKRDNANA